MKYRLSVLPEADQNVDRIFCWLAERTPAGARRWYLRFLEAVESLRENPQSHGYAPENEYVEPEIRQAIFKTRRGRPYRVLFRILQNEVQVLHVRGPGQDLLAAEDLPQE